MQVRIARSARKHRVGAQHIRAAMQNAGTPTRDGDALIYRGIDDRGIEIEVVAVPDDKHPVSLTAIHAMPTDWRNR